MAHGSEALGTIDRRAFLTICLQGLHPSLVGGPDTQADAAALEHAVGRLEIGGDFAALGGCRGIG
jgi:hypothetical protein